MPAVQLTTHVKSSTLYGRTVVHPNFLGLKKILFCIIMGLRSASSVKMQVVYQEMARDGAKSNVAKWNLTGGRQFKYVKKWRNVHVVQ